LQWCEWWLNNEWTKPRSLTPGEISELIFDTESKEARMSSDSITDIGKDGGVGVERGPGVSQQQLDGKTLTCHDCSSSILSSASGEEDDGDSEPCQETQQPATLQWTWPSCPQRTVVQAYTWGRRGKDCEASYINDGCVDKRERMTNSYSIGSSSFKRTKKIVFPPAGPGYSQQFHSSFLKEG
jgi:hypothetical protein